MTLLKPLGLLGLIGVIVLIIIYIIRPNFQQKFISSTYIWKLSLKYRRKKLPTSRLRNLLLILCQVLILTICAAILSQPAHVVKVAIDDHEVIAILDSSASMRTVYNDKTRFERAISQVKELANEVFAENGKISVILADDKASFVTQRTEGLDKTNFEEKLDELIRENACSYGESNIDDALTLSEEILAENPATKIYLYTDNAYAGAGEDDGVQIVPVTEREEWNVGILDASTELVNNYYTFTVNLGYYSDVKYDSSARSTVELTLKIMNTNPNAEGYGQTETISHTVYCNRNQEKEIVFITEENYDEIKDTVESSGDDSVEYVYELIDKNGKSIPMLQIYSYDSIFVSIDSSDDSYNDDNHFYIFNGQKPVLRVQYYSEEPNPFFSGILLTLQSAFADTWDMRITEVKKGNDPALSGFDLYLFEHTMPEKMPTDGVVFLADPRQVPKEADFRIEEVRPLRDSAPLTAGSDHKLLSNIDPDKITVKKYTIVTPTSTDYETLMTCDANPMLMIKNQPNSKVVLMNFDLHYSNLPISYAFPLLMCNIVDYFFPATLSDYDFEVYENVSVNARGDKVVIYKGTTQLQEIEVLPSSFTVNEPGTYIIEQALPFSGETMTQFIFVKASSAESNIWAELDALQDPYRENVAVDQVNDWLMYFAAALVALLFIEWWLQSRETM